MKTLLNQQVTPVGVIREDLIQHSLVGSRRKKISSTTRFGSSLDEFAGVDALDADANLYKSKVIKEIFKF